jgi:methionyl-tRNA formyltransferase
VRILFAGTPDVAVPTLQALLDSRHEVVAVLTRPDAPSGRGRTLAPSPVRVAAEAAGVRVITDRPDSPEFFAALDELKPVVAAVVAYGNLLRPAALDAIPKGWINLHFSVLPAWRGAAPVQRALIAGDEITGATTFLIEEGMDTGPVLGVVTEPVHLRDTSGQLLERMSHTGARLMVDTLDAYEDGDIVPVPQGHDGVSRAAKLTTADAQVDFSDPAMAVDRLIRGCTPEPGAWAELGGQRIGLGPVTPQPEIDDLEPGQIQVTKRAVLVGTATHAVELGEVKPPGKKLMAAADWARGAHLDVDAMFRPVGS